MATMIHERQNEPVTLMTITNLALHNQTLYTMAVRPPQTFPPDWWACWPTDKVQHAHQSARKKKKTKTVGTSKTRKKVNKITMASFMEVGTMKLTHTLDYTVIRKLNII